MPIACLFSFHQGAADGLKKTDQVFEEVDNLLKDGRKYLLGTDEPTYIDYTFASLAAIGILPDQYGGPRLSPDTRPVPEDFGPEAQAVFKKYRKRPAGQFVLRMYKEHR
jgi:glutathione S-transferase